MSILRELNDEIIEKLKVTPVPPDPLPVIRVGDEFEITFVVTNESRQFPGMKFSNVTIEIMAIYPFAELIDGDAFFRKRLDPHFSPGFQ